MSWLLDIVCGRELVQTGMDETRSVLEAHYEKDEMVVHRGDSKTGISIIVSGKADVLEETENGTTTVVRELGPGDCFGVNEFLVKSEAKQSIRCQDTLDVVTYTADELEPLLVLPEIRQAFEHLRMEPEE